MCAKSAKKDASVYVIAAKTASAADFACDQLLDQLLPADERPTCLFAPETGKISPSEVFDELRTLPFLAEKRVVLLKNADDFVSANRQLLEKYFDSPSPTGVLILTVESWPGTTKLAKKLPGIGVLIETKPITGSKLAAELIDFTAKKYKKTLARPAAWQLIELIGSEPAAIYKEIEKLDIYTADAKAITTDDVAALVGQYRQFSTFEVIDQMLAKRPEKAIEKLRVLFASDRNAEYVAVGAFAWQVRRFLDGKCRLGQGENRASVAKALNLWRDSDAFFARLSEVTLEKLGGLLVALADIDYAIKTGRTTAASALERFIVAFSA